MKSRALVLFDIDGTLVRRAGPHHREALVEAVRAPTGWTPRLRTFLSTECSIPTF
jgi:beta-phosphoglucomutase-like phosphatase (HAD superfamily)